MKTAEYKARAAKDMLERDFGLKVEAIAKTLGLRYYHTFQSQHSAPGWPDYVFASPKGNGVLFRELKRQGKNPTEIQQSWIDTLAACGQDVEVWRPEDLFSGRVAQELQAIV